jgi:antitoxin (DNA-binding transcriptional repressor) of toxin-antitoxin stability system
MRFVSARELRNHSGRIQAALRTDVLTLTSNGEPIALMVGLAEGEDPTELERALVLARAQLALQRARRDAQEAGTDRLDAAEIDAEIAAARAERGPP